jgi:hypothetical protein
MGFCILSVNEEYNETQMLENPLVSILEEVDGIWELIFDGACSKKELGPI